jgi:phosphotriesterase-related protein
MQHPIVLIAAITLCAWCASAGEGAGTATGKIETVCGPIDPAELGPALTHEHILVDFVGADKVSRDRYDPEAVVARMLPYLKDLKAAGVEALFECTPDYLGRDPVLLRRLSIASGVKLITNTGLYKDPYLPQWAHEASAEDIAARWIEEATLGIGPERIRPGFIKIAANEGDLTPIQRKIVRAAALASRATGLVIACHTTTAATALQELDILHDAGTPESRLIVVHADATPDLAIHAQIAARAAWLSYDGIREGNARERVPFVLEALRRWPAQLLISQDAGWYHVGEPNGGDVVALDWLPRAFLPMLREAGLTSEQLDRLLVRNPAEAFTIQPPIAR